jgi:hypothetical protein
MQPLAHKNSPVLDFTWSGYSIAALSMAREVLARL